MSSAPGARTAKEQITNKREDAHIGEREWIPMKPPIKPETSPTTIVMGAM